MKKNIILTLAIIIFSGFGCSHYIEQNQTFEPPSLKNQPRLFYPKIAQQQSLMGKTKVIIYISKTGEVENARVLKSSGFSVLDTAAVNYCKTFTFYPAKRNGKEVNSNLEMNIKFNLADQDYNPNEYVQSINDLYSKLEGAKGNEKNEIEKEILNGHSEFLKKMKDALNFNIYVEKVISTKLAVEWKNSWDSWPLSFLLYQDFIERFPNYDNIPEVKQLLFQALKFDLRYINISSSANSDEQKEKENLLINIRQFVEKNYPDFIRDSGLDFPDDTSLIYKNAKSNKLYLSLYNK
jgi:TonB family protein